MDFDVADDAAAFGAEEEDGVEEVGTGLKVPASAGLHLDRFAGVGGEFGGAEGGVVPDALEVALRPAASGLVRRRRLAYAGAFGGQEGGVVRRVHSESEMLPGEEDDRPGRQCEAAVGDEFRGRDEAGSIRRDGAA